MVQATLATSSSLTSVIAPGPARVITSSLGFDIQSPAIFEHYACERGERIEARLDLHLVSMHLSDETVFERRTPSGNYENCRKLEGALSLFPAGFIPDTRVLSSSEIVYCAFPTEFIDNLVDEEFDGKRPPLHIRNALYDEPLRNSFLQLLDVLSEDVPASSLHVDSITHAIAVRSLQLHSERSATVPRRIMALSASAFRKTEDMLRASLHENISLTMLADNCGYSSGHFLRMFQASTGLTPHEYQMRLRIQRAKAMLSRSNHSLIEIAAVCGFSNQSHLTSVFRRRIGTTPFKFRKQNSYRYTMMATAGASDIRMQSSEIQL